MRQKIFNRGKNWYIFATNYKDDQDTCYIDLYFPKGTAPEYIDNGRGISSLDIDIEEAKFTSYKGKAGLTIFKYKLFEPRTDGVEQSNRDFNESVRGTEYERNFGTHTEISQEELPFY